MVEASVRPENLAACNQSSLVGHVEWSGGTTVELATGVLGQVVSRDNDKIVVTVDSDGYSALVNAGWRPKY